MTPVLTTRTFPPLFPPPFATGGWGDDRYGLFADLEFKDVVQRLRWIPPGEFLMGSDSKRAYDREKPVRKVTLTRGFWLADTPCTQEFWTAVMGKNPSHFQEDGAKRPVEQVSWDDCQRFLDRLGGALDGLKFALPSEAQWEYACRAGSVGEWCFGDDQARLEEYAWYGEPADGSTHPVKGKQANAWGLHDMHGNVWEWCQDHLKGSYAGADPVDPQGPPSGSGRVRVVRGGSWYYNAQHCRSAYRSNGDPAYRGYDLGFRPVLAVQ